MGYPLLRDLHSYGYLLLEARHGEARSEGGGFKFTSAADIAAASVLLGHSFDDGGSVEAGITVSNGWRSGPAPRLLDDGDNAFWHVRAGFGVVKALDGIMEHLALHAEAWGQYTDSRLPSLEQFYLGDRYSLRGYSFSEYAGDVGFTGSVELTKAFLIDNPVLLSVMPFGFFDVGFIENNQPGPFEIRDKTLASTGAGLEASFAGNLSVRGYVGVPLVAGRTTKKQSYSVYLSLSKAW